MSDTNSNTLTSADIALLRAVLWDGDAAVRAFAAWKTAADPENVHNEAHFRLLPLLHDNLARLGVHDPVMPRLKQLKYQSWGKAQKRLRETGVALQALAEADLPIMVTKGAALIDGYYANPSHRPMSDIDMIVMPRHLDRACNALESAGWSKTDEDISWRDDRERFYRGRAYSFQREGAVDIDLHWQPFHECLSETTRIAYWDKAEEITLGGGACLRPAPDKLLFHIITHGMRPNELNPMRWIVDSAVILKARKDQIDWKSLYHFASKTRLLRRLRLGLSELEHVLDETFPPPPRFMRPSVAEMLEQSAFRKMREDENYESTDSRMVWSKRIRLLSSDAVLSPNVWLAFAERARLRRK